jgi:hypothetical protein
MSCYDSGLVFGESWRWPHPTEGLTEEAAELLSVYGEPVSLPGDLTAVRWRSRLSTKGLTCPPTTINRSE